MFGLRKRKFRHFKNSSRERDLYGHEHAERCYMHAAGNNPSHRAIIHTHCLHYLKIHFRRRTANFTLVCIFCSRLFASKGYIRLRKLIPKVDENAFSISVICLPGYSGFPVLLMSMHMRVWLYMYLHLHMNSKEEITVKKFVTAICREASPVDWISPTRCRVKLSSLARNWSRKFWNWR